MQLQHIIYLFGLGFKIIVNSYQLFPFFSSLALSLFNKNDKALSRCLNEDGMSMSIEPGIRLVGVPP